jgi:hypothetical protein
MGIDGLQNFRTVLPNNLLRRISQALPRRPVPAYNRQIPVDRKSRLGRAIN